jgi:dTDP-4-amino-4,6-dideoxygalactose transaminase
MKPAIRRLLPDAPQPRYTVHAGTNQLVEVGRALPWLLAPGGADAEGAAVRAFEAAVASRTHMPEAVAFGAGRMALWALVAALQQTGRLAVGDEVVLPGFTCAVVPNALRYRGLVPKYADINGRSFNVDPDAAAAAIGPRTRALYLQHTFGQSADVAALQALARKHDLVLIEDAAHSFGAHWKGRPHGSLGDVAFFSTDRTKVINTHLGGVAMARDPRVCAALRRLQQQAWRPTSARRRQLAMSFMAEAFWRHSALLWLGRPLLGALRRTPLSFTWSDESWDELPAGYSYPSQLAGVQAATGLSQLRGLDANLAHRRRIARWLEQRLGAAAGVWDGADFDEQAWLRYSVLVRDRPAFESRFGARIDLGTWFTTPIFGRDDAASIGYVAGSCPVAEHVARHIVNLPTHPRLPLRELERLWKLHGTWLQSERLAPL